MKLSENTNDLGVILGIFDIYKMILNQLTSEEDKIILQKFNSVDKFVDFVDTCKDDILSELQECNKELEGTKTFTLQNISVEEREESLSFSMNEEDSMFNILELMLAASSLIDVLREMSENDDISLYMSVLKDFDRMNFTSSL